MTLISISNALEVFTAKSHEFDSYTSYEGTPEKLAQDLVAAFADFERVLDNEDYCWLSEGWVKSTIKKSSKEMCAAIAKDLFEIRRRAVAIMDVINRDHLSEGVTNPALTRMTTRFAGSVMSIAERFQLKADGRESPEPMVIPLDGSDTETEESSRSFVTVQKERKKKGKSAAAKVKTKTMSLKEFRESVVVEDDTPFDDSDNVWGFGVRDRSALCFRTHATFGWFLKDTDTQVPKREMDNYRPADLQRRVVHECEYIFFQSCSAAVLRSAAASEYFPEHVLDTALRKGLFSDELEAVGKPMTQGEADKLVPGCTEIADILFWQARAEAVMKQYGLERKLPFVRKWFPRFADVPDHVRSGAGDAARTFYEWIRRDCIKSKVEDRNLNKTFNGFMQGMLAKWPKGWDRAKMLEKYRPSVRALWGKDLAPYFEQAFLELPAGKQLMRPKHKPATTRLLELARKTAGKARAAAEELATAAPEHVDAARQKVSQYVKETARIEQALTWRQQAYAWQGRFVRSLPDFLRSAPKPLRIVVTQGGKKSAEEYGSVLQRTSRWIAATIGLPFVQEVSFSRLTTDPEVSVIDTKIAMRPWLKKLWEKVYRVEEIPTGFRAYDPVPGLLGTATAIGAGAKYIGWDLPRAAINRIGVLFNNYDEEPLIEWPEAPSVWAAAVGTAFAAVVGAASAYAAAVPMAAFAGVSALTGIVSLGTMDLVNWIRGRKKDEKTEQFFTDIPVGEAQEIVDLQKEKVLFDADVEAGFETIQLTDNRTNAASRDRKSVV